MLLPPLLLLLLCFTAVHSSGPVQTCCLKTTDTILPLSKIAGYYSQKAGLCPVDAVVFVTVKNVKICSPPNKLWVKRAVKYFGSKKTKDGKKVTPPQ
ncbi:C-C motif chemokine 17-like [Scleropages formosus]|uniref:C-C motif chemokine 17-like n=1 Tax=Scleropages formosus TaxID=113540 RepID=UPI000878F875|nr:C-C motif chemokine 17-like [Scleropages formosus]